MHIRSDEWLDDNARCIELIEHMLAGNVDVTEHSIQHDDILEVDRSKFNRCVDVPCYTLVGETQPDVIEVVTSSRSYKYMNCGKLIYKKEKREEEVNLNAD